MSMPVVFVKIFKPPGSWGLGLFLLILLFCMDSTIMAANGAKGHNPYDIIIKKDPFNPARGYGFELADGNITSNGGLGERYQVYGIITVGGKKRAYLKVEASPGQGFKKAGGKAAPKFRTLSIGDLIDGWKVVDITHRGIFLESEDERIFVGVFETRKEERRGSGPVNFFAPQPRPRPLSKKTLPGQPAQQIRKVSSPSGPLPEIHKRR